MIREVYLVRSDGGLLELTRKEGVAREIWVAPRQAERADIQSHIIIIDEYGISQVRPIFGMNFTRIEVGWDVEIDVDKILGH